MSGRDESLVKVVLPYVVATLVMAAILLVVAEAFAFFDEMPFEDLGKD